MFEDTDAGCEQPSSSSVTGVLPQDAAASSMTKTSFQSLSDMFPNMPVDYAARLEANPEFSEALLKLLNNCNPEHQANTFNAFNKPRLDLKAVTAKITLASQALEDGCSNIAYRLERLGGDAQKKLTSSNECVASYKQQAYTAMACTLASSSIPDREKSGFFLSCLENFLRDSNNQYHSELNKDRAPWIRKALNAITWTLSVLLTITVPCGFFCSTALHVRKYARTGDYGFFARPESATNLRVTELNVANEVGQGFFEDQMDLVANSHR